MTRALMLLLLLTGVLALAGVAFAQEEAHYEGYWVGSDPRPVASVLQGRGLVTALYPPLVRNFFVNEYTWVIDGLVSQGSVLKDSVYYTTYTAGNPSSFTIFEDPTQNARPTFYNCPSDIIGLDPRYNDGAVYLRGHFTQFSTTFDTHVDTYGQGTYTARLNWDSGTHVNDLPANRRGGWTFGGTTTDTFACMPPAMYYQALTGRIFQMTTGVQSTTWGNLKSLYR